MLRIIASAAGPVYGTGTDSSALTWKYRSFGR